MSLYLAVELSDQDKRKLSVEQVKLKQNAKGDWEDPTRFHITVSFLNEDCIEPDLAIEGLKLYETNFNPHKFDIIAKDFFKFEQGVMWVGLNNSLPLYSVKHDIDDCLRSVGYPMKKDKHPGYTPHITMGYGVHDEDTLVKTFEGIPMTITNVSLWNGFKANGVYIHNKLFGVNFK
jgi:2'-5' RNA ligase